MAVARIGLGLAMIVQSLLPAFAEQPREIGGEVLAPLTFADLPGWNADDHTAAFAAFRRSCEAMAAGTIALRPGTPSSAGLAGICEQARALPLQPEGSTAKAFFERHFRPFRVGATTGFITGYFEPEIEGARSPSSRLSAPVLVRPADLVTLIPGETVPGLPDGLTSYRRDTQGRAVPYPARADIEAGALGDLAKPLLYVDPVDLFMAQVQGSVRVHLDDGTNVRLAYAGRNGQPYTSLGKVLSERLQVPPAEMTADRLYTWLKANREEGRALMRLNKSYVFFRIADELDPALGPLGAASVQLTPGRSIAVDRHLWPYGLPFFLAGDLPTADNGATSFARLVVAQDTGAAILGAARADLFIGSGPEAGLIAGRVRQSVEFVVLLPVPAER